MGPIFTIDARNNFLLEAIQGYFNLNTKQLFKEINGMFNELNSVLSSKKIKYQDLKSALIPNPEKNEMVYVFDTSKISSAWYGYEVFENIMPLFDKKSNHSVLCGDFLGTYSTQERLSKEFSKSLVPIRKYNFEHSSQFYLVYINNLSDEMHKNINDGLSKYVPYIGYIELNYSSFIKTYFSAILINCFIKHKNIIVMAHEDDREDAEDINIKGYPFEVNGYLCRSMKSMNYDVFLSYKIERNVYKGYEIDTTLSLNAITSKAMKIDNFNILIDEKKLTYLKEYKTGKLKKANLINFNKTELEQLIKNKINSNYIYNMEFLEEYDTLKFNLIIETVASDTKETVKLTLALEYIPKQKELRLITMF